MGAPLVVTVLILVMDTSPGNLMMNSCGNVPVHAQNVSSSLISRA